MSSLAESPSFPRGQYLGGLADTTRRRRGNLIFESERIGLGVVNPRKMSLPVTDIASIEVFSGDVAVSVLARAVALGVFGAIATRGRQEETVVLVHTKKKETAYFRLDRASSMEVRARLAPWMRSTGVHFTEDLRSPVAQQPVNGLAEQLEGLARLHASGALNDAEFAAAKATLLHL